MRSSARTLILVTIAVILAIIAISMQFSSSEEVATERPTETKKIATGAGKVGIDISESADVEDRGNNGGTNG